MALASISKRQYGTFSRIQALESGLTPRQIERRPQDHRWERLYQGVYRLAGMTPSVRQDMMAAVLAGGTGAVASHRAAAWLLGLPGGSTEPEITVPRGCRPRVPGVTLHTTTDMPVPDWGVYQNIPVTTPARLLVDMVPFASRRELEILVDAVLAKDLAKRSRIAWRIQELSRQGRETGVLVEMLEARTDDAGVPASVLESLFRLVVQGFPGLTFNRRVVAGKERRVDCELNPLNLVAELDGWAHHFGRVRSQDDMDRQNALHLTGKTVMRYSYEDITRRPQEVRTELLTMARRFARKTGDPSLIAAWAVVEPRLADQAICGSGSGSMDARRRKTSTTSGSNCTPAPASRRSSASSTAKARR